MKQESRTSELDGRKSAPSSADRELLGRVASKDPPAFAEIVSLYRDRVARLAYRLLGWDEQVEDVVQDVFLAAFRNLKGFRGQGSLWSWLAAITVNRCRSLRRRRLLRLKFLSRLRRQASSATPGPTDSTTDRETLSEVRSAVRALPARLREVTVLRYLEEMPIDEIARVVRISRNAVDGRLHRARARLRERLAGLIEEGQT